MRAKMQCMWMEKERFRKITKKLFKVIIYKYTMTGVIVPLYSHSLYPTLVASKILHPNVDFIAIVNPNSGPGLITNTIFTAAILAMKAVGIKVIGYVPTKYGARALASVKSDIDSWVTFYPDIVGINFDEFATSAGQEVYYDTINKYAKSKGLSLTVGNPGAPTPTTYDGLVDIITIYESSGLPPISTLSVMKTDFTKSKLGYLAHTVPVFDPVAFASTLPYVSYCYVT